MRWALILLVYFFGFLFVNDAQAAYVVVAKDGNIVVNVLSDEAIALEIPERNFEITDAAGTANISDATVSVTREGEEIKLVINNAKEKKELNITDENISLIEIEERSQVKRLSLGVNDGKFTLKEGGLLVTTEYPVKVDSKTAKISVATETGDRYISILPSEAIEGPLKAKVISSVGLGGQIELTEEGSDLIYTIPGQKDINVFNLFTYGVPVTSKVSASNGEILATDPPWFMVFNFLFG